MPALDFPALVSALQSARQRERHAWERRQAAQARMKRWRRWGHLWFNEGAGGAWPRRQAEFWTLQHETEGLLHSWMVHRSQALLEAEGIDPSHSPAPWLERSALEVPPVLWEWVWMERR